VCSAVAGSGSCSHAGGFSDTVANLMIDSSHHLNILTDVHLNPPTTDNPDGLYWFNADYTITVRSSAAPDQPFVIPFSELMRCDSATRGGFTGSACIYANVLPAYELNINDSRITEVAAHIRHALNDPNTTMPPATGNKIIPSLLNRTTDQNLINANRDRATYQCDKWLEPRPTGKSCDEYPFASTYQGSLSNENDYSIERVNADQDSVEGDQNSTEGGYRSIWYRNDRILEDDQFLVGVYDGPAE